MNRRWLLALAIALACTTSARLRAPDVFRVRFETTRGTFVVEVRREWAPVGADRFHDLVRRRFFDGARFFRVRAGAFVQFGIPADPRTAQAWRNATLADDPVRASNERGTLAYAFTKPGTRATQVFINLKVNKDYDAQGFAPFGRVVSGMDVVDSLYSGYGESSGGGMRAGHQDALFAEGNAWLDRNFPKLDAIVKARLE
ncbi:MAG TPA: peptidylprolyl isomerase [Thermoanaerobaculia bacterium]|jgi:cyclophilin family peptidyl-prolyl cis-trans isomerase|nr:peptidylprolyl isomerase [Thermoanaerobaculia bacterium]